MDNEMTDQEICKASLLLGLFETSTAFWTEQRQSKMHPEKLFKVTVADNCEKEAIAKARRMLWKESKRLELEDPEESMFMEQVALLLPPHW